MTTDRENEEIKGLEILSEKLMDLINERKDHEAYDIFERNPEVVDFLPFQNLSEVYSSFRSVSRIAAKKLERYVIIELKKWEGNYQTEELLGEALMDSEVKEK